MKVNSLSIGSVIEYYRLETGSLEIDSNIWQGLESLVKSLLDLRNESNPIVSVSSCGPAIYVLTRDPVPVVDRLGKEGMEVFSASPNNSGCTVFADGELITTGPGLPEEFMDGTVADTAVCE